MAFIQKFGFVAGPLLIMAAGSLAAQGCDPESVSEDVCGPCGDVTTGSVDISGSAQIDGFFAAVDKLSANADLATKGFAEGLANLEVAFDLEGNGDLNARVEAVIAAIEAEIEANAAGELVIDYQPAQCTANIDVAVEAQAKCEAQADCNVEANCDAGELSVTCEGSCTGSCEGECSGDLKCEGKVGVEASCEGTCEGSCELEAGATCEGTCQGTCEGTCEGGIDNGDGTFECEGTCEGECQGTCELKAAAQCEGTCHGKCIVEAEADVECEGELKCEGSCEGSCTGGCEGTATPPSCTGSAECEATADCQASASAEASADIQCTPPNIEIEFRVDASIDASARATFAARMAALQANVGVMMGSFTRYSSLFEGEGNAAASIGASMDALGQAVVKGDILADIPSGRVGCVLPAVEDSAEMLSKTIGEASGNIEAQAKFAAAFSTGFSG